MNKPDWWPENPYPSDLFPMEREEYATIVPDPIRRTALTGMLGREIWEIASEMIWSRIRERAIDGELSVSDFLTWEPTSGMAIPPGEYLREVMDAQGVIVSDILDASLLSRDDVHGILNGDKEITPKIADVLQRVTGVKRHIWLGLEGGYRKALSRNNRQQ